MGASVIDQVKQDASRVVRNLPEAHASWQFWRNAAFRRAIQSVVDALYALDIDKFSDDQLKTLDELVEVVLSVIDVHTSTLGTAVRDTVDREYFRELSARLRVAAEGLEQGLSPDPAKRPSDEELMDQFAAGIRRAKLA
jgi:hypothetical protein